MHVSVVGARLRLPPPALGKSQQRALGGEEKRGYPEAVVALLSGLEDVDAENGVSGGALLTALDGAAVECKEDDEEHEFLGHGDNCSPE